MRKSLNFDLDTKKLKEIYPYSFMLLMNVDYYKNIWFMCMTEIGVDTPKMYTFLNLCSANAPLLKLFFKRF